MSANFISIKTNFPSVVATLDRLADNIGNKAMVRALNTTVVQGKTDMARKINQEFRVNVGTIKKELEVQKAVARTTNHGRSIFKFEAVLSAGRHQKGRSMNLIAFIEKQTTMAQARKRMKAGEGGTHILRSGGQVQKALQVRFQVKRSGGKKVITGAFIGNKGRTLFVREGSGRFPIKALNTIDIPQMFNTKRINSVVLKSMTDKFQKNFDRELRAVLKGYVK